MKPAQAPTSMHPFEAQIDNARALDDDFAQAFVVSGVDLLATPTTPMPAPLIDQELVVLPSGSDGHGQVEPVGLALLRLTAPANLTGLPALTVPAGVTERSGLTFGLHLMARPFAESLLLSVAHVYEESVPAPRTKTLTRAS